MSQNQQNGNCLPEWLQAALREAAIRQTLILDHKMRYDLSSRVDNHSDGLAARTIGALDLCI